jgi:hypothetical protein
VLTGTLKGCTIRQAVSADLSQNGLEAIATPRMRRFWNYGSPVVKWIMRILVPSVPVLAALGLIYSFLATSGVHLIDNLAATAVFLLLEFMTIYIMYRSWVPESITRHFIAEDRKP